MTQKHAFGVLRPQRLNGPMRYIVSLEASRRDASTEPYRSCSRSLLMELLAKTWAGWGPPKWGGPWGLSISDLFMIPYYAHPTFFFSKTIIQYVRKESKLAKKDDTREAYGSDSGDAPVGWSG